ncbi:MAG: hypothetical protein HQL81_07460 [Magnetococcales bacterium]|nr:hypothetical protein [Magnetococcales bacterium]
MDHLAWGVGDHRQQYRNRQIQRMTSLSIFCMGYKKRVWATLLFLVSWIMGFGNGVAGQREGFLLIMDAPTQPASTWAWELLRNSRRMETVIGVLQASFSLPRPLTFRFGEGEGPVYDPQRVEITIPYPFIADIAHLLSEHPAPTAVHSEQTDTLDVVEWVVYHELAHAFVDLFNLPVLGREEDAADALATLLAIELVEDGGRMALTAADLLARVAANAKNTPNASFWNEHTVDQQRFSQVVCWVYGSDTTTFAPLANSGTIPHQRAQRCPDAFSTMAQGWWRLLDRYIKPA